MNENLITALDIGSSKIFGITGLVRETENEKDIEVLGTEVAEVSDKIIKRGRIVDIEEATNLIFDVIQSLKEQTGERIEWITIGVGGAFLQGKNYSKKIEIVPPGREIGEPDIQTLEREIRNSIIAGNDTGRKVLYVVPQEYIIDEQNVIKKKPIGMHGNTLEMKVHVITVEVNPLQDILNCIKNAGVQVEKIYPHSWAVAESVLSEEEKKLGCIVVDIGKGTTDFELISDEKILLTHSIKIGSWYIDYDLSIGLHTPLSFAEEIKKKYGWCNYNSLKKEKSEELTRIIEIFNPAGQLTKKVKLEEISKIVYERAREILEDFIKPKVMKTALLNSVAAGVVLSGGGARLKGLEKLCEEIFELPARTGTPCKLFNLDRNFQKPEFSCGIGLLMLASKHQKKKEYNFFQKVKNWIKKWF
ncbi:cell division protein FtsA [bacterium]|nr:cell division protein FtsA [bacterium]